MSTWLEQKMLDLLIKIDREAPLSADARREIENMVQVAKSMRRFETIGYDPKVDSVLTISTQGDRTVGIWPADCRIIFPLDKEQMMDDRFDIQVKEEIAKLMEKLLNDRIGIALWHWEEEELVAEAERQADSNG